MNLRNAIGSRTLRYAGATLAVIAACAGALVMSSRTGQAVTAASAVPVVISPTLNGRPSASGPEALLFRTLNEVANRRLHVAVAEIDKVIEAYPNFRLAHLIKGDLLLARARPLTTVGNARGVPPGLLEDLREEARARLARIQHPRPVDLVPRYLLQMPPEQQHALVVDTAKSTLYVFANRGGEARYVSDYYVSIGKNGIDKLREGDNKTPLGVYHVTSWKPREMLDNEYGKLAELYGVGAFPINYPNDWDRARGRNGSGIWVHGVPFDTYSRSPRASNGCIALANEDLDAVAKSVQIGLTPVIIANGVDWVAPGANAALRRELLARLDRWRRDWEARDTERYLAHYSETFTSGKTNFEQWAKQKRRVNAAKTWIRLKLDNVSVFLYPGRDDLAVVNFDQDYASSNLLNKMRKRQYWIREDGAWRILHEGAA